MLDRHRWAVREHVGILRLSDVYDILDPDTGEALGIARESAGALNHIARMLIDKRRLPTTVHVFRGEDPEDESARLFSLRRRFPILRSKIDILNDHDEVVGTLQNRLMSIGGAFDIFDASGEKVASVTGNWVGWKFEFKNAEGEVIGRISKDWAGSAKELFTSADNYLIDLDESADPGQGILLLAAGLAIDIVLKEK